MTIMYQHYILTGTVDECIEFITKMTPCTVGTNIDFFQNVNDSDLETKNINELLKNYKTDD